MVETGIESAQGSDDNVGLMGLCHDLSQYIAAGLLLSRLPGDEALDEALQRRLDLIYQQFRSAADLVATQVAQTPPEQWLVDLVELVDECVAVVELTHNVSVETEAEDRPMAYGDPALVRRAVANVLDNASRAAGHSGTVHVRIGEHDGSTWVEIEDHGPGFGRIAPGRGYGLRIADWALRKQRGHLEITSAPAGTLVRLELPSRLAVDSQR